MGKKQPARAKISFLAISQFNVNFVKGCGFLSARTENMRRENGYALSRRMFRAHVQEISSSEFADRVDAAGLIHVISTLARHG